MDALTGLEDAVKTALTPMAPSLRTLDIYSGQLDIPDEKIILIHFPCIFILALDIVVEVENGVNFAEVDINLFIGDRNLRGALAATRGDGTSSGVYSIMQSAFNLLHNKRIYDNFATMQLIGASHADYRPTDGVCFWIQTYKIRGDIENG